MKIIYSFVLLFITTKGVYGWPALNDNSLQNEDQSCSWCPSLVTFIDKMYRNDSNLLENALINVCNDYSRLPGHQTTRTCEFMVKSMVELFNKVNKQTFCEEICVSNRTDDSFQINEVAGHVADDPNCNFCVTVVTNVKDIVSGAPTELEVKYFIEDACHYLGSFENECVSLSDEYIDTLFAYIRTSLQPKKFCQSIGACPALTQKPKQTERLADIAEVVNIFPAEMPLTPLKTAEPVERPTDEMECLICKRIVKLVVQELEDNRTQEAIIQALERVCSLFPQKERQKCDSFVESYGNELIHIIIEEGDPALACTLIGVCVPKSVWQTINRPNIGKDKNSLKWIEVESPITVGASNTENVLIDSQIESNKSNKVCYECELLMHFLQNQIYDYNNEEQVEEFIEHQLCDRMKTVITKEACDSFVQQYGPQVMQLIAQKMFDPSNVCHMFLNLCSNSTQTPHSVESTQLPEFQMIEQTAKCNLCVSLVQLVDTLFQNKDFDKEITKFVTNSCKTLPKEKKIECQLMVEAFLPYFLQKVGHLNDSNEVCRSIDMCYKAGLVHLLGGHKCTFGPTYWCHTIAHAEACKASNFCKTKVWKPME